MCVTCAMQLLNRRPGQALCAICRTPITSVVRLRTDLPVPNSLFVRRAGASQAPSQEVPALRGLTMRQAAWPASAKRFAVSVEPVRRPARWWLPSLR